MALTESNMPGLGMKASDFTLPDTVSGEMMTFNDIKGMKGTVILFICNHCPYVIHVNAELVRIANEYKLAGIGFVAISSNDAVNYPDDAPEKMRLVARYCNILMLIYMMKIRILQKHMKLHVHLIFMSLTRMTDYFTEEDWMNQDQVMINQ